MIGGFFFHRHTCIGMIFGHLWSLLVPHSFKGIMLFTVGPLQDVQIGSSTSTLQVASFAGIGVAHPSAKKSANSVTPCFTEKHNVRCAYVNVACR